MPLMNTPFNALDFLILLVFVFGVYSGYKQGFVLSFFKFFGYIIAIIATKLYYGQFALLLQKYTPLARWVEKFFTQHIDDFFTKGIASKASTYEFLPFGKDLGQLQAIYQQNQTGMEESIKTYLVAHLSELAMNLISIVLLFVSVIILLQLAVSLLDIASKLPVIRSLNKLGGLIFGLFKMFVLTSVFLILIVTVASLSNMALLTVQLDHSMLAPYFMRYNILLLWIGSALLGI